MEYFCYVVVEVFVVWLGVHADDCAFGLWGVFVFLLFYEFEVGYWCVLVEFQVVGVEAYDSYVCGVEGEVEAAEHFLEDCVAGAQAVVVAYDAEPWFVEFVEDVAHEDVFHGLAEVGQVAAVDDEVDVFHGVDGLYGVACVVVSSLCVAEKGKADVFFVFECFFYLGDVCGVVVGSSFYFPVVWVCFEGVAACEQDGEYEY